MVDVLRAVVDALCRLVPTLAQRREDKKLRRMGARLFMIYVRLVETLMAADRIIDSLEHFAQHPDNPYGSDHVGDALTEQAVDVARLRTLLSDNAEMLILLDGDCYARLAPLLEMKVGFLSGLEGSLRGELLPLGSSEGQIEALMDQAARMAAERPDLLNHPHMLEGVVQRHLDFQPGLALVFGDPLDAGRQSQGKAAMVQKYLEARKPRGELARLKDATTALGKALTEHFSVDEILLEVDSGLRRRDR